MMKVRLVLKRRRARVAVLTLVLIAVVLWAIPYVRCMNLEHAASMSIGGRMGCGIGVVDLTTSTGVRSLTTGLDGPHVFGRDVHVDTLVSLLDRRAAANKYGFGPMAGNKRALCTVILDLLSDSGDPGVIEPIARLLTDQDEVIRGWAATALYRLGDSNLELRPLICQHLFSEPAASSAEVKGAKRRDWVVYTH